MKAAPISVLVTNPALTRSHQNLPTFADWKTTNVIDEVDKWCVVGGKEPIIHAFSTMLGKIMSGQIFAPYNFSIFFNTYGQVRSC